MKYYFKQKQKERKRISDVLKNAVFEQVKIIKKSIYEELNKIAIFIQFLVPLFLVAFNANFITVIIVSIATTYLTSYIRILNGVSKESTNSIPEPPRKFIEVDKDGFIGLKNENDMPELIQYMYELEKYLENKGRLQE